MGKTRNTGILTDAISLDSSKNVTLAAGLTVTTAANLATAATSYAVLDSGVVKYRSNTQALSDIVGYTPVPNTRTITINGTAYDLTADRSWTIAGGVTSFNTRTGAITLTSSDVTTALGYTPYSGTVTTNYIPKVTAAATLGNSIIYDNGSQLGIGTTNPNTRLGIVWNNGLSGSVMDIQNTNAAGGSAIDFYNNAGTYMGNMGGYAGHGSLAVDSWVGGISFRASGVEAAKIATTRQLRLNAYTTTTSFTGTAAGVLAFDSSGNIITIATPGGTTLNGTGFVKANGTTIIYDSNTYLTTTNASTTYLALTGGTLSGSLGGTSATFSSTVSAATFTETSSIRYKENIVTLVDSLSKVLQLRGVEYNRKGVTHTEIGVIAEEVSAIYPDVVKYNAAGNPDSVSYGRLTAVLIEAVKEQQQQINELKALLVK